MYFFLVKRRLLDYFVLASFAFVVLGLILQYHAKSLEERLREMTYFVSSRT